MAPNIHHGSFTTSALRKRYVRLSHPVQCLKGLNLSLQLKVKSTYKQETHKQRLT